jgi:glutathione synthase/RimK-type ligase-like ATP-grasp enzyme
MRPSSKLFSTTRAYSSMFRPKHERLVTQLIREIAREQGLIFKTFSGDWIISLHNPVTEQIRYIHGYSFGLNSQAHRMLCTDKAALSAVLATKMIPHVEHELFLSPHIASWIDDKGVFDKLFAYAQKHNFDTVVKPKDGERGIDVFRCQNKRSLESAALTLFCKNGSLVISPFEKIDEEFRVIMLDGCSKLIFKKDRYAVMGDGKKTIRELLIAEIANNHKKFDSILGMDISPVDLDKIPLEGKLTPVSWKHNLSSGATASVAISDQQKVALSKLAKDAVQALGVRFVSVDIIQTANLLKVIEINSAVTLEKVSASIPDGRPVAQKIYAEVVDAMFREPEHSLHHTEDEYRDGRRPG